MFEVLAVAKCPVEKSCQSCHLSAPIPCHREPLFLQSVRGCLRTRTASFHVVLKEQMLPAHESLSAGT